MPAIKTILHPTDFLERSELATRLACSIARDHGARLIVVHVVEHLEAIYGDAMDLPEQKPSKEPLCAKHRELTRRIRAFELKTA